MLEAMLEASHVWQYEVLFYISGFISPGFISRSLKRKVTCPDCVGALHEQVNKINNYGPVPLIACKAHGDLFIPSSSLFQSCQDLGQINSTS